LPRQLQDNAQHTAASIAGLSTVMSSSARLQAATSRLDSLQSDVRLSQLPLAFALSDLSDALVQHFQSVELQIAAQCNAVALAQETLSAGECRLRAWTDAGSWPPRDDSPIHVDPVTHLTSSPSSVYSSIYSPGHLTSSSFSPIRLFSLFLFVPRMFPSFSVRICIFSPLPFVAFSLGPCSRPSLPGTFCFLH